MAGQQPLIIWLNVVLMILTFTALCARVGRRIFVVRIFSGHDALLVIATVAAFAFSIFQMVGTTFGLGLHQRDIDPSGLPILRKLILASNVFYFLCNWAVKHALLFFYSEIVLRDRRLFQYSIWIMHFVAFGFGSSSILVNIFQCRPLRRAWRPEVPGYCVTIDTFFYFNASIMLATDLILYVMPVVFTWHLQLRRPQRIGLNCLFGLGVLVLTVSAARVYSVHKTAVESDDLWWFATSMIFSVLENHLAIVVACAPSVKVIALLIFPRLASSLGKVVSRVTPSTSRSRSRTSGRSSGTADLESGPRKGSKPKLTPLSTPLSSPAFTPRSGTDRVSQGFAKWFRSPTSPRHLSSEDSMEGGLVYVEEFREPSTDVPLVCISKDITKNRGSEERIVSPILPDDIRVQHTITVENRSARSSNEGECNGLGVAVRPV